MVYRRVISKNGKKYIYLYENYRGNDGRVKNRCLGRLEEQNKVFSMKHILIIFGFLFLLIGIYTTFYFYNLSVTGNTILSSSNVYLDNGSLKGSLTLGFLEGELIPSSSRLVISQEGTEKSFSLLDLLNNSVEGDYFVDGFNVSGTGTGIGLPGQKVLAPEVCFTLIVGGEEIQEFIGEDSSIPNSSELEVLDEELNNSSFENDSNLEEFLSDNLYSENSTEEYIVSEESSINEEEQESLVENDSFIEKSVVEESLKEEKESLKEEILTITGGVISPILEEVSGCVDYYSEFSYFVGLNSVEIKEGSLYRSDNGSLENVSLNLESFDGEVFITTDFHEVETGFGEDYLGNFSEILLPLESLNLSFVEGNLDFKLIFDNLTISQFSLSLSEGLESPVELENLTSNESSNLTLPFELNASLLQYSAVVGQPVKWVKRVTIKGNNGTNQEVNLHSSAMNISIKSGDELEDYKEEVQTFDQELRRVNRSEIIAGTFTGNVVLKDNERGFFSKILNSLFSFRLTGEVILEEDLEKENLINRVNDSIIVNLSGAVSVEEDDSIEVAVEYYTPAPIKEEIEMGHGKKIIVSSEDELNYTNILAYTTLYDSNDLSQIPMEEIGDLTLYWYAAKEDALNERDLSEKIISDEENYSSSLITGQVTLNVSIDKGGSDIFPLEKNKLKVNFTPHDLDGDNYVDYIEWIVPHLSEQVYEIIYITGAVHLNENRSYLNNIYEPVKELDGFWSEPINNGEFVRVTFEKNLTKVNDITIYARSNLTSSIEVFVKGGNISLATFKNISEEKLYKIYLTNLSYEEDIFDLKIDGSIEFDYIVDPTYRGYVVFDGNDDFVQVGDSLPINLRNVTERSTGLWFYPIIDYTYYDEFNFSWDNYTIPQVLWEQGRDSYNGVGSAGMNIYIYKGRLYGGVWSKQDGWGGSWPSIKVDPHKWSHVFLVYTNTGEVKLYLDGELVNSTTGGNMLRAHPSGGNGVGAYVGGISYPTLYAHKNIQYVLPSGLGGDVFHGDIDEFIMFNDTVTTNEVKRIYDLGRTNFVNQIDDMDNLVMYYDFDDTPNDWSDDSGNSHTGIGYQGVKTVQETFPGETSYQGWAEFDGVYGGDYARSTTINLSKIQTSFTISAWVKPKMAATTQGRMVASTYGYMGHPTNDNHTGWNFGQVWTGDYFRLELYDGIGGYASASYSNFFTNYLDEWVHVTGVYNGSNYVYLYINGQRIGADTTSVPASVYYNPSHYFTLGMRSSNAQSNWNGSIDEVLLFDTVLSDVEVEQIYENGRSKFSGPQADNLIAYYDFDDTPDDWSDDSENGNTLVGYYNSYTTRGEIMSSKYGGQAILDGGGDYVNIGDINVDNDWSISFWEKHLSSGNPIYYPIQFSATTGIFVEYGSRSDNWGFFDSSTTLDSTNLNENEWYFLTVTKSGLNYSLYQNGNFLLSGIKLDVDISDLRIGTRSTHYHNGSIDEVIIFNRTLTPEEVKLIYNLNRNPYLGSTDNLVAYYDFDDTPDDWSDDSGNGYDGTGYDDAYTNAMVPSNKRFDIKSSIGEFLATLDDRGNAFFRGKVFPQSGLRYGYGYGYYLIDEEEEIYEYGGYEYVYDIGVLDYPNSFKLRNSSGANIAVIDNEGNLFLKGNLSEEDFLTGITSTNLQIRDSSNELVSLFDNQGNLRLSKNLREFYDFN